MSQYAAGSRLESASDSIQQVTKMLQKKSVNFRNAWAQFCQMHGGGKNDPMKQPAEFHVQFFDVMCSQVQGDIASFLGCATGPPPKALKTSPSFGGAMGGCMGGCMGGMMGGMTGDPHTELVNQIKSFQRMGEAQKQAWWDHCDQILGGVRDPAKHDIGTLQSFVHGYGVGPALSTPQPPAGGMQLQLGASMDPEKSMYVTRIKAFQKADPMQKEAWDNYCNSLGDASHTKNPTKDPARHETSTLLDFISQYGVP